MDESGTITFTVIGTDDNGCENTASIDVEVADEIVVTSTTEDEISGSDGAIDITISGGVGPYTVDWDTDEAGDFDDEEDLTGLAAGTYTIVVMDDNGCTTTVEIVVDSQVGIESSTKDLLSIYPNPTSDFVVLELTGKFTYSLSDISGAIILNGSGTDLETISLNNLANGAYFISVKANDSINTVKVIKK
jgi:hypothetical protein